MAIGERIKFFRNMRGFTQKALGLLLGFPEKTADIRLAQYESGTRSPKSDLTNELANILEINKKALTVPDVDDYENIIHTFFALEDLYSFKIEQSKGEFSIKLNMGKDGENQTLTNMFSWWNYMNEKLKSEQISQEEYDNWRYSYPKTAEDLESAPVNQYVKQDVFSFLD